MQLLFQRLFIIAHLCAINIFACRSGEYEFDSRCFRYIKVPNSFNGAENYCKSIGYHLVSIRNAFENGCLQATAKIEFETEDSYFRIGLNTSDMIDWRWTDNSPYNYWAWGPGEPVNNKCAAMYISDGKWKACSCDDLINFVCASDPNGIRTTASTQPQHSNSPIQTSPTQIPIPSTSTDPCFANSAPLAQCAAQCPSGWDFVNGKCYKFFLISTNWNDAAADCRERCSTWHLPRLYSQQQGLDLYSYTKSYSFSDPEVWIDVHKMAGDPTGKRVENSDGQEYACTFWSAGYPSNKTGYDCGNVWIAGLWDDYYCDSGWNYHACETDERIPMLCP